jgi:preprotein translocase subunit YajC
VILGATRAIAALAQAPIAASNGKSSGSYGFLIVLVLFGAVIYLLVLRPQRSRMRKAEQQRGEVEVGARVMTASGMYGTVAAVEDDAVLLEIAPGVTTRWARAAIGRVVETEEALGLDGPGGPTDGEDPER